MTVFADTSRAAPLLEDLAPLGPELVDSLASTGVPDAALLALHRIWEQEPERVTALMNEPGGRRALVALCGSGTFLPRLALRVPDGLAAISLALDHQPFHWPEPGALAASCPDFAALQRALRQLAGRAYLYLATRDLGMDGGADNGAPAPVPDHVRRPYRALSSATHGLSELARVTVEAALTFCRAELAARHGEVRRADGAPCPFFVLGMGKLGAGELNYGSDIDLILLHGDGGQDSDGERPLSPQEFFTRLSRNLSRALAEQTADGRVFRVDLRLRPEGASGVMAWPVGAAMAYYETVGDTWERAAYIKAVPLAGDREAAARFLKGLAPFVFRRYLDFPALEGIRDVKERIHARQVARDQVGTDVKLGSGGIRDIEFFVQSQQLIHGGRNPALRPPATLDALAALVAAGQVDPVRAHLLAETYVFLRHVEHRVQLVADEQTHLLPTDPERRRRLGCQMGFADTGDPWLAFWEYYQAVTSQVHEVCLALFQEPDGAAEEGFAHLVRQVAVAPEGALDGLDALGLADPETGARHLRALARVLNAGGLPEISRQRWRKLLPLFLEDIAKGADPDLGLAGLARFAEALKGRGIYAAMLHENRHARQLLSRLFCTSRFLTGHLARYPHLVDELLAPPELLGGRDAEAMTAELARATAGQDEEGWLDAIRRFKHREVLRVGLREIAQGADEVARGQDLARLAEVLVTQVLHRTWTGMAARHGVPPGIDPDTGREQPGAGAVAVVALGRLGGGEMGYASDLDLLFIHNGGQHAETPGPRPIPVPTFFTRLGQRLVSKLTVGTGEGVLYEVDMRLRPSGASGQLVTSLSAFEKYQAEQAWTWEKQALTRARVVAAEGGIGPAVARALWAATYTPRDLEATRNEVAQMRARMRRHLSHPKPGVLHLKHDPGGIVDVEFTVQFLLLAHGHAHPEVTDSSPRAALEKLANAGLIGADDAKTLLDALALYRTAEGYLNRVYGDSDQGFAHDGPPMPGGRNRLWGRVQAAMQRVDGIFRRIVGWVEVVE
ncbi:MAG: bifunctional [glutamate--ammonia ligase]-adenylyl-L-tyrosine phosphorylase/[glutamate--ammonia-ligase] adenylyltransferase [Nitrospirae bacterium]|nr:bifunctional [glutamate--ammonia ligase]-adenylyl-L-tyrosine phosphorylase/[glutamate--ammonia-ligase] adenylyltransferase [Nitrospirota bacterium]